MSKINQETGHELNVKDNKTKLNIDKSKVSKCKQNASGIRGIL